MFIPINFTNLNNSINAAKTICKEIKEIFLNLN